MSDENGVIRLIAGCFREKKGFILIIALLVMGICLMIWGGTENEADTEFTADNLDVTELEERVSRLCSRVKGAGSVSVMITVDTVSEKIYAQNNQYGNDYSKSEYVTVSGKLIPLGERSMTVRGVAVVCEGGDDAAVRLSLTQLICSLFSIGADKVRVVCGK